jgi:hypoxanthine phosphoribosyltransferase
MRERPDLAAALKNADKVFDRAQLEAAIAALAAPLDAALGDEVPVMLTVLNGGLIFAGQLALALARDVEFDYVHATRYRSGTAGHELKWIAHPRVSLKGRVVLLVDDILDEGYTLKAIREHCVAEGAARVLIAVLCEKRHGRCVPGLAADFVAVEVPDRYVFGYGMDYYEQGRNLPGIYALKESA